MTYIRGLTVYVCINGNQLVITESAHAQAHNSAKPPVDTVIEF